MVFKGFECIVLLMVFKEFECIVQPLHKQLSGAGATKKNEHVMLMQDALGAFETLKKA